MNLETLSIEQLADYRDLLPNDEDFIKQYLQGQRDEAAISEPCSH